MVFIFGFLTFSKAASFLCKSLRNTPFLPNSPTISSLASGTVGLSVSREIGLPFEPLVEDVEDVEDVEI